MHKIFGSTVDVSKFGNYLFTHGKSSCFSNRYILVGSRCWKVSKIKHTKVFVRAKDEIIPRVDKR